MPIKYPLDEGFMEKLNQQFLFLYNYEHWFYKLRTYDIILEETDTFLEEMTGDLFAEKDREEYQNFLKSEIVFTFYHSAEALFSLMKNAQDCPVPWLGMRNVRVDELYDYAREYIQERGLDSEDARFLFFNGIKGEEVEREDIQDSLSFIQEYLVQMADVFLENDVFRAYKHGLRVITSQTEFRILEGAEKPLVEGNSITFTFLGDELLEKEGSEEFRRLEIRTEAFDYKLYLRLAVINYRLIKNFFESRQQRKKLEEGDKMQIETFTDLDLTEVFEEDTDDRFEFSIKAPTGERGVVFD